MQRLATHRISSPLNSARKCAGDFSFGNLPPQRTSALRSTPQLHSTQRYFGTTRLASLLRGSMHLGTSRLNSTQRFVWNFATHRTTTRHVTTRLNSTQRFVCAYASLHRTAHHFSAQHHATIVLLRRTASQRDTLRLPAAPRISARRNTTICLEHRYTARHVASRLSTSQLTTTQRFVWNCAPLHDTTPLNSAQLNSTIYLEHRTASRHRTTPLYSPQLPSTQRY